MKIVEIKGYRLEFKGATIDTNEKLLTPTITGGYAQGNYRSAIAMSIALWHFKIGFELSWFRISHQRGA